MPSVRANRINTEASCGVQLPLQLARKPGIIAVKKCQPFASSESYTTIAGDCRTPTTWSGQPADASTHKAKYKRLTSVGRTIIAD